MQCVCNVYAMYVQCIFKVTKYECKTVFYKNNEKPHEKQNMFHILEEKERKVKGKSKRKKGKEKEKE